MNKYQKRIVSDAKWVKSMFRIDFRTAKKIARGAYKLTEIIEN